MAGKIYAIISVVQGNGAKYVATNLAKALGKGTKKEGRRVLLVDFDFEYPFLAHDLINHDMLHGIDTLVPHIYDSVINEDIFRENIIQTRIDIDVLRGTKFPGKNKQYSKQHIEGILNTARELYDDVIVVISPKANNAGTIYTLFHADEIVLVVRNNYANTMQYERTVRTISQYTRCENPISVVYNMQNQFAKSELKEKLKDSSMEVRVVGVLEWDERSIDNIDLQKKDSMFGSSSNKKNFEEIAQKLI